VKVFRNTGFARFSNRAMSALIRAGIVRGPYGILTVPGRRTGLPRSNPVELTPIGDGWRVFAAYGLVDWVKNLQAAGTATIQLRRQELPVTSRQLPPREAAAVLLDRVASASGTTMRMIGPYFDATSESPIEAWELEAEHHPVFVLQKTS